MTHKHKEIWLQPWCNECARSDKGWDGRQWCEDDVWTTCDDCERKSVRYILAPEPEPPQ